MPNERWKCYRKDTDLWFFEIFTSDIKTLWMHDVQCIYGFVLWNCRHISEKLEYYSLKNDLENEMTFLSVHVYCVKF